MKRNHWLGVATCAAALTSSLTAAADVPVTANSIQLGFGFRYGFQLNDTGIDPWRAGLGLGVAYTLPNAVYVGANFDYFFGEKKGTPESSAHLWQISAEGGYDIGLGSAFVIRPKVGVGVANVISTICVGDQCADGSDSKLAIAPGATFILRTTRFSVALDLRYDVVLTDPETAKALIFSAGVGF